MRVNDQVAESRLKAVFNDCVLMMITMMTATRATTTAMTMMAILITKIILR